MKTRLILCFTILLALIGCKTTKFVLSAVEFAGKIQELQNAQIVDVRTPEEFVQKHLPNAVNIDVRDQFFDEQIKSLNKSNPVFVYCRSGKRSVFAAEKMRAQGFNVYELQEGIQEWEAAKLPVKTE